MATLMNPATTSAQPNSRTQQPQSLCVDPVYLSQKLEAVQLERESRSRARNANRELEAAAIDQRLKSMSAAPVARTTVVATADGKPVMDIKHLHALLHVDDSAKSLPASKRDSASGPNAKYSGRHVEDSRSPPEYTTGKPPGRSASLAGFRSGRAGKQSEPGQQMTTKLVAIKHGSQTAYERIEIPRIATHDVDEEQSPEFKIGRKHDSPRLPAADMEEVEDQPMGTQRPNILRHDRPHWAQQSQCGDDMRSTLQIPGFGGREPQGHSASKRPGFLRRHSSAPHTEQQESTMISDAVKLIKKEERNQRRQSVMGFFKKL
ncbi:hypothetical protein B0A48_02322 [Cryoendolithus antarcticus]|uniref:Uncharacterized protein n=1 Tax=Cryoendolithus antarcticus TaxID=1507870 RepID=A0A1V8TNM7_9PEZI|nr:hypothetical protein B0A48_02322 [Cryoendolithus antarcticus]